MDELLIQVLGNLPTFGGLVALALMQWRIIQDLQRQTDKQDDRYDRLVEALIKNHVIQHVDLHHTRTNDTQELPIIKRGSTDNY